MIESVLDGPLEKRAEHELDQLVARVDTFAGQLAGRAEREDADDARRDQRVPVHGPEAAGLMDRLCQERADLRGVEPGLLRRDRGTAESLARLRRTARSNHAAIRSHSG